MLRKKNKLPAEVHSVDFELEYGTATIEVHKDSIQKNEKVIIIDDLIATGGTAKLKQLQNLLKFLEEKLLVLFLL